MLNEMLISGFGGQGIVTLGKLIAYAGMIDGREVCYWPHYGAEMRGGTAFCTVILSSEKIDSPVVDTFDTVVAMNHPSVLLFQEKVKPGGNLFWNSSIILKEPQREDVTRIAVNATALATELGNTRVANIIVFGALSERLGIFSIGSAIEALRRVFTKMSPETFQLNQMAIKRGADLSRELIPTNC